MQSNLITFDQVLNLASVSRATESDEHKALDEPAIPKQPELHLHTPCPHLHRLKCRLFFKDTLLVEELALFSNVQVANAKVYQAVFAGQFTHEPLWSIRVPSVCKLADFDQYASQVLGASVSCVSSEHAHIMLTTTQQLCTHQIPNELHLKLGDCADSGMSSAYGHRLHECASSRLHYIQAKASHMSFEVQWNLMLSGFSAWALFLFVCDGGEKADSCEWEAVLIPRDENVIAVLRRALDLYGTGRIHTKPRVFNI
jgi:hypothetical protein